MQYYDISLTPTGAGAVRQLDAQGDYFYFYAGSAGGADTSVTLQGRSSGTLVVLKPGQAFRLAKGKQESSWVVKNKNGAGTIVGTVVIGSGEITDNRVTGQVEVIDGGKARTLARQAFIGYAGTLAPAAGFACFVELWNPAGSGLNLVLEQIQVSTNAAGNFAAGYCFNAAMTTLSGKPQSKLLNGLANNSVAELRAQNAASGTVLAGPAPDALFSEYLVQNQAFVLKPVEPLVIAPGFGLSIRFADNTAGNACFEHYEESIA